MITRWILSSIWESISTSAQGAYLGLKTDAHRVANSVYDYFTVPNEKQLQEQRKQQREKYQTVTAPIKNRQEERKALSIARHAGEGDQQLRELNRYKENITALLAGVLQELTDLNRARLPFLWRNKIKIKNAEKIALDALLNAKTFAELKLIAEHQQKLLNTIGSKHPTIQQTLQEINDLEFLMPSLKTTNKRAAV